MPPTKSKAKRKSTTLATAGTTRPTTVYLSPRQHTWLRRQALDHSIAHGGRVDASAVIRGLVDAAMPKRTR